MQKPAAPPVAPPDSPSEYVNHFVADVPADMIVYKLGGFVNDNNATKDVGQDAAVTVNGASAQSNGLSVSYRSSNLDIEFDLDSTFNKTGTGSFEITGGGATFSLGSKVICTTSA